MKSKENIFTERLYDLLCFMVENIRQLRSNMHVHKMSATEMRLLRWMSDNILRDRIRNECIREKFEVASIKG